MQSDSIPAGTIARPSRALFALALDAQEIDGELALAMALLSAEDPEERQQGEELITTLLEAAGETNNLLVSKSDQLLELAQWLQARAAHLKATAKQRLEAAVREEEAAAALVNRVAAVLSFRNPGQKSFALPEHKLASRATASVEVSDLDVIPDRYAGIEVKVRVPATGEPANHQAIVDAVAQCLAKMEVAGEVIFDKKPDKKLIAQALKAKDKVPGAELKEGRSWRIA